MTGLEGKMAVVAGGRRAAERELADHGRGCDGGGCGEECSACQSLSHA